MNQWVYEHEFECGCGCRACAPHPTLVARLNMAREAADVPFIITSGTRCREHNAAAGGSPDSAHLVREVYSYAADIAAKDSASRMQIVKGLLSAGFDRIGIGSDFVHADIDIHKPSGVMWTY